MRAPRRVVAAAVAAGTALALAACSSSGGAAKKGSTIKFAVVEPFSGPLATYGALIQKSVQAAAGALNDQGGILGHKIEVVTRDDGFDPTKTVTAARELATDPSVALILGPSFSSLFNAAKNVYEQNKKVNCAVAVNEDTAFQGLKYGFRAAASISKKVEGVLAYAAAQGKIKNFGLVVANDDSGKALDAALKAIAPKYNLDYRGANFFSPGAQSQVPQVSKLNDADAIFLSATVSDAAITASNARDAGFKGTFLGVDGLLSNFAFIGATSADQLTGTILSYPGADYLTRIPQEQWPAKYRETIDLIGKKTGYNTDPKSGFKLLNGSSLVSDCVTEWAAAAKKANSVDPAKVAAAWENLSLDASQIPTGIPVKFTPDSHEEFSSYTQLGVYTLQHDSKGWYLDEVVKPSLG